MWSVYMRRERTWKWIQSKVWVYICQDSSLSKKRFHNVIFRDTLTKKLKPAINQLKMADNTAQYMYPWKKIHTHTFLKYTGKGKLMEHERNSICRNLYGGIELTGSIFRCWMVHSCCFHVLRVSLCFFLSSSLQQQISAR